MQNDSRRKFLKTLALATVALVAAPVMKIQQAFAGEVDPDKNPTAKALGYKKVAKDAKDRKDKKAFCHNCNYFQGTEKSELAPCQLMANEEVRGAGWCRSWAMKSKK